MQPFVKWLLTAFVAALLSIGAWAQESARENDPDVLARHSYHSFPFAADDGVRDMCIVVSSAGDYRLMRSLWNGTTQRLQGRIPAEQFQQFKKAVFAEKFRGLSGHQWPGVIRGESESFAAEIPVPDGRSRMVLQRGEEKAQRLQWLNPDGESPFPPVVARVVNWLKRFEPKDGKRFDSVEFESQDVCPTVGLSFVQPSVATNSQP
jgi:hypothetical protein